MRISKVTTKTGDQGITGLADGSRVSKADPRICAIGDVDELNSFIGSAKSAASKDSWKNELSEIQNDLLNLGGELSMPESGVSLLSQERVDALEHRTEAMNETLPQLKEFILPEGSNFTTRIHMARAVCRRAERAVINAVGTEESSLCMMYLNRLSDFLFVLARMSNASDSSSEQQWNKQG
ncbi:MAG: cob(I)yrinic acid a,c-diamide adenosyltransferase [Candidatus Marinimicrobia bacterium]|jgi:cob(I)alamin adenosyltransferase|nr:cob(I)yrinic acid a,c-diamide adenosyltransferase [Candidatus Neomarinimicrobiota bacterium]MDP6790217.1 cob(I)yrinic acid a,c-diamide adenosyltransferase [Candidatus Neomarinimicrobiota bacterium]MDP7072252.1 cob(I)yrinic acid a,c-diamide adenosyltransferase [Candidatus Neomarinimicrobiota bacterium]